MNKLCALLVCILMMFGAAVFAQEPVVAPSAPVGSGASSPGGAATSSSQESKMVETWLNMAGQFNDRLLATVYWSLSAIGGFLVAMVGFGWFVNFRVYERDKSAMLTELRAEHQREMNELKTQLSNLIEKKLQGDRQQVTKALTELTEKQIIQVKNSIGLVSKSNNNSFEEIYGIKTEMSMAKAEEWKKQRIFENQLTSLIDVIEYALKAPSYEWRIADALRDIGDLLKDGKISRGDWETEFMRILPRIPASYASLKERALNHLSALEAGKP